jgi:hypothetical protein
MNLLPVTLLLVAPAPEPSFPVVGATERALTTHRLSSLQQFYESLRQRYPSAEPADYSGRDVVAGFREYVVGFRVLVPDKQDPNSSTVYSYRITLLTEGDAIIYHELAAERSKQVNGRWQPYFAPLAHYQSPKDFPRLTQAYRTVFGTVPDLAALFDRSVIYGTACGIAGTPPPPQRLIRQLVARRDTAGLTGWLRSEVTEKQVYGVQGFYQLHQQGLQLNPAQRRLIQLIRRKQGTINACDGCLSGHKDMREVTKAFGF